jgi:chemotaxis protein MotB
MNATEERRPLTPTTTWIITYGDAVTLLLTFFILTTVILSKAQQTVYLYLQELLSETEYNLKSYVEETGQSDVISFDQTTKGVKITIANAKIFDSNEAEIKGEFRPTLQAIAELLRKSTIVYGADTVAVDSAAVPSAGGRSLFGPLMNRFQEAGKELKVEIRVEGHTDNQPIIRGKFANNLELSTARALSVVNFLSETAPLPKSRFSALGYGEYRPIATNATEEGRALNRRVEIYVDAEIIDRQEFQE